MLCDAFSVAGRMRISLSGQVPLVVFCGIANRKLFDFDALRMASVSADTVFGRKNAEIFMILLSC